MDNDRVQLWLDGAPVCPALYHLFTVALNRATRDRWRAFALVGGGSLVAANPQDAMQVALFTYDYVQAEEDVVVTGRFTLDDNNMPIKWEGIKR